jgi:hypothetical protein
MFDVENTFTKVIFKGVNGESSGPNCPILRVLKTKATQIE